MGDLRDKTTLFKSESLQQKSEVRETLQKVHHALQEKGYNPIGQLVGYLLSGDPTFITNHCNARSMITQLERDIILEELITTYLQK